MSPHPRAKWTPRDTKTQKIPVSGAAHGEGGGTQSRRRNPRRVNPQGPTGTLVQDEGGKGGAHICGIRR